MEFVSEGRHRLRYQAWPEPTGIGATARTVVDTKHESRIRRQRREHQSSRRYELNPLPELPFAARSAPIERFAADSSRKLPKSWGKSSQIISNLYHCKYTRKPALMLTSEVSSSPTLSSNLDLTNQPHRPLWFS